MQSKKYLKLSDSEIEFIWNQYNILDKILLKIQGKRKGLLPVMKRLLKLPLPRIIEIVFLRYYYSLAKHRLNGQQGNKKPSQYKVLGLY